MLFRSSFGQNLSAVIDSDATAVSACTEVLGGLAELQDRFKLDHSLLDEEWHGINYPSLLTTQEGVSAVYGGQTWGPFPWPATTWLETNVVILSHVSNISKRVAGLHMDGSLADVHGGTYTDQPGATFTTSGQKFGTGAAVLGGIRSQAIHHFATFDFAFRFWLKLPLPTGFGMFIAGRYVDSSNLFGIFVLGDVVWLRRQRPGQDYEWVAIGTMSSNTYAFVEFGRVDGVLRGSIDGIVSSNTLTFADDLGTTWFDLGVYASSATVEIGRAHV